MDSDIMWDRIVSIEYCGYEHVYDIEVEGTHNFIGNGIFAHNTYRGDTSITDKKQDMGPEPKFLVAQWSEATGSVNQDTPYANSELGLIALGDGLGGYLAGEVASGLAVNTTVDVVSDKLPSASSTEDVKGIFKEAGAVANLKILYQADSDPKKKNMATTLAAGLIWKDKEEKLWWVGINIGDCRIYIRKSTGEARLISKGDNVVSGDFTAFLGRPDFKVREHQVICEQLDVGDIIFLASDGLYTAFETEGSEKIEKVAERYDQSKTLVQGLVAEFKRKEYIVRYGSLDDASIVGIKVPEVSSSASHFSLRSRNNAFSSEDEEPNAEMFRIGEKDYSVTNKEAIEIALSKGVLVSYDEVTIKVDRVLEEQKGKKYEVKIRIIGGQNRPEKELIDLIKRKIDSAITRSMDMHKGDLGEEITIILADKYDYAGGDHRPNNIEILNRSDLENMFKDSHSMPEGEKIIEEYITSVPSEEFSHERGAKNNPKSELYLANRCAENTIRALGKDFISGYLLLLKKHFTDKFSIGSYMFCLENGKDFFQKDFFHLILDRDICHPLDYYFRIKYFKFKESRSEISLNDSIREYITIIREIKKLIAIEIENFVKDKGMDIKISVGMAVIPQKGKKSNSTEKLDVAKLSKDLVNFAHAAGIESLKEEVNITPDMSREGIYRELIKAGLKIVDPDAINWSEWVKSAAILAKVTLLGDQDIANILNCLSGKYIYNWDVFGESIGTKLPHLNYQEVTRLRKALERTNPIGVTRKTPQIRDVAEEHNIRTMAAGTVSSDADLFSAHSSLISKNNSRKDTKLLTNKSVIGETEYDTEDETIMEKIKKAKDIEILNTALLQENGLNITFTILGPPKRERLAKYLKEKPNLLQAILRSKSLQEGTLNPEITIILADKYDYLAGDHRKNNLIILNASDLEDMLEKVEKGEILSIFFDELLTSLLAEELAHERGAKGDAKTEERLAQDCAHSTKYFLSHQPNPRTLSEYIAFIEKYGKEIDKGNGYLSYLKVINRYQDFNWIKDHAPLVANRTVVSYQMEMGLSKALLENLYDTFIKEGYPPKEAERAVGQIAELTMAGGLGNIKRDLVESWYEKGTDIISLSPLYGQWIKGIGVIDQSLVNSLLKIMGPPQITFKTRIFNRHNVKGPPIEVKVSIYRDPFSPSQYWIYCPQILDGAYPEDDAHLAQQLLLYRKASLKFLKYLKDQKKTKDKFLFSLSEPYTALLVPGAIKSTDEDDPDFQDEDVYFHYYNHTRVAAGMRKLSEFLYDIIGIDKKYKDSIVVGDEIVLASLIGQEADLITGCSIEHTRILEKEVMERFSDKIPVNISEKNSEGVYLDNWMGKEMQKVYERYFLRLNAKDDEDLFRNLDSNKKELKSFIKDMEAAKERQKRASSDWRESLGVALNPELAIVSSTRRIVKYKRLDIVNALLSIKKYIDKFKKLGLGFLVGGRRFDRDESDFGIQQITTLRTILEKNPGYIAMLPDYNIFSAHKIYNSVVAVLMLSDEGEEAGPTSPSKGLINGAFIIATPDGVIPELLIDFNEDPVNGNGFRVEYHDKEIQKMVNTFLDKIDDKIKDELFQRGRNGISPFIFNTSREHIGAASSGLRPFFSKLNELLFDRIGIYNSAEDYIDYILGLFNGIEGSEEIVAWLTGLRDNQELEPYEKYSDIRSFLIEILGERAEPTVKSLFKALEGLSKAYKNPRNRERLFYNALKTGILRANISTRQGPGLIELWQDGLEKKNKLAKDIKAKRILLVDNKELDREIYSLFLEKAGYKVIVASSLSKALDHMQDVDIVVTDLSLIGPDGITLAEKFKNRGFRGPIIVQTTSELKHLRVEDQERAKAAKEKGIIADIITKSPKRLPNIIDREFESEVVIVLSEEIIETCKAIRGSIGKPQPVDNKILELLFLKKSEKHTERRNVYSVCIDTLTHNIGNSLHQILSAAEEIKEILTIEKGEPDARLFEKIRKNYEKITVFIEHIKKFNKVQLMEEMMRSIGMKEMADVASYKLGEKLKVAKEFIDSCIEEAGPLVDKLNDKILRLEGKRGIDTNKERGPSQPATEVTMGRTERSPDISGEETSHIHTNLIMKDAHIPRRDRCYEIKGEEAKRIQKSSINGKIESTLDEELTSRLSEEEVFQNIDKVRSRIEDLLTKEDRQLNNGNLVKLYNSLDDNGKKEFIRLAKETSLTFIEGWWTIDGRSKFAHARRGISGLEPTIWVPEKLFQELRKEPDRLAQYILEEIQHVYFKDQKDCKLIEKAKLKEKSENIQHSKEFYEYLESLVQKAPVQELNAQKEEIGEFELYQRWEIISASLRTIYHGFIQNDLANSLHVIETSLGGILYMLKEELKKDNTNEEVKIGVERLTGFKSGLWSKVIDKMSRLHDDIKDSKFETIDKALLDNWYNGIIKQRKGLLELRQTYNGELKKEILRIIESINIQGSEYIEYLDEISSRFDRLALWYDYIERFADRDLQIKKDIGIKQLLYDAIESLKDQYKIEIKIEVEDVDDIRLNGDEEILRLGMARVFSNLAHLKEEGSDIQNVIVEIKREDNRIKIFIFNDGTYLESDSLKIDEHTGRQRIFNINESKRQTGTGLGTALLYQAIAMHGGDVRAYNHIKDGMKGVMFEIELPIELKIYKASMIERLSQTGAPIMHDNDIDLFKRPGAESTPKTKRTETTKEQQKLINAIQEAMVETNFEGSLILFGSHAQGIQTENSDVDLSVELGSTSEEEWEKIWPNIKDILVKKGYRFDREGKDHPPFSMSEGFFITSRADGGLIPSGKYMFVIRQNNVRKVDIDTEAERYKERGVYLITGAEAFSVDLRIPASKDSNIKLILIDVGNTLFEVDFHRSVEKLRRYCPDMPKGASIDMFIYNLFNSREKGSLGYRFESGEIRGLDILREIKNALKERGTLINLEYDQFIDVWNAAYGDPIPENIHLMKSFIEAGYDVRLLSDNNPIHWIHVFSLLAKEGIVFNAEHFISSYDLGVLKSDPELWEAVIKGKLGDVPASKILFIDDSDRNVRVAEEMGIRGVLYREGDYLENIRQAFKLDETSHKRLISDVDEIYLPSGMNVSKLTDFERIVGEPVVLACMILNYKGIRTTASLADKRNVRLKLGRVWIRIDTELLSPENKKIAEDILTGVNKNELWIPITEQSSVEEVSRKACEVARRFKYQDRHETEIDEFIKFDAETPVEFKGAPLINILDRLLSYFVSYENMRELKMLELGPRERQGLIKFLRTKAVDIEGIDGSIGNGFVKRGDFVKELAEKKENSLDVVYYKNALGGGLRLEGVDINRLQIDYNNAVKRLFKDIHRVLKPNGIIIIDSMDFIKEGDLVGERLQKADFEEIGFEIFERDEKKDIYVFVKMRRTSIDTKNLPKPAPLREQLEAIYSNQDDV